MFGLSNPFHNEDLVDADNVITKDENGEDPAYNQLGPTGAETLAGDWTDDDGQAIDDLFTPNPNGILGNDGISHADEDDPANPLAHDGDPQGTPTLGAPKRSVPVPFGHRPELTDQDKPVDVADETSRILIARLPIGSAYPPAMLLPRDPNRVHLVLTFDDTCQWGGDNSSVYTAGGFPGGLALVLDKHTGSVWVYGSTAASGSYAYAWAVTS